MLLAATLAATDMMVWHLLISEGADKRISYIDSRLHVLCIEGLESLSFRFLEGKRHVVGWCGTATELSGDADANDDIKPSGLGKPPALTVIDNLYLEAGTDIVGGFNINVNVKEQPFWLQRGKDYPSLLKWVGAQPIVFCDAGDRRAWLVDGASALLHLVRISLYMDENDPESTYDWVFHPHQLKDR
ncbi:hypothetical protein FZEAL_3912 [Fusarium zealandicum]|uniref:Uncharacterized protein n=1 Tax=Fusarium zealandicum TaxID=1053134 RepID=A0A8H4UN00_9HYPO|nr:hypothetical protein FZEAL_3912 [Fusarium zealandicum]